jgi:hypothetical protein
LVSVASAASYCSRTGLTARRETPMSTAPDSSLDLILTAAPPTALDRQPARPGPCDGTVPRVPHAVSKKLPILAKWVLPHSLQDPLLIELQHNALAFAVVGRGLLHTLDVKWDSPGTYVLIGHAEKPGRFHAYVGMAPKSGLRKRVGHHEKTKTFWDRAVLIRRSRALSRARTAPPAQALRKPQNAPPRTRTRRNRRLPTFRGPIATSHAPAGRTGPNPEPARTPNA